VDTGLGGQPLGLLGRAIAERGVKPLAIVIALEVSEQLAPGFLAGGEALPMNRGFGLTMGAVGEWAFVTRARELARDRRALAVVIEPLLQISEALLSQCDRLHCLVVVASRDDEVCRRIMTVPGVGSVRALTFCSAVDDPGRFSCSRAMGPISG
jgi:Transposase IS116/IS110/IS902 family